MAELPGDSTLCKHCNNIDSEALSNDNEQGSVLVSDDERRHALTLSKLYNQAGKTKPERCRLCIKVLEIVQYTEDLYDKADCKILLRFVDEHGRCQPVSAISSESICGVGLFLEVAANTWQFPTACRSAMRIYGPTQIGHKPLKPSADEALSLARGWLDACEHHIECGRAMAGKMYYQKSYTKTMELPLRLMNVTTERLLVLSENKDIESQIRDQSLCYAALSYRWGRTSLCLTKKGILKSTSSGHGERTEVEVGSIEDMIPLLDAPRVIQDAAKITKRLSIPYLWVDSLCITQDDTDEMDYEIGRASGIYENAHLTIAMITEPDRNDSFFGRKPYDNGVERPWIVRTHASNVITRENFYISSLAPLRRQNSRDQLSSTADHEIIHSSWNTRAWVFQEYFSARRILYVGAYQLYWQCASESRAENGKGTFMRAGSNYLKSILVSRHLRMGLGTSAHTMREVHAVVRHRREIGRAIWIAGYLLQESLMFPLSAIIALPLIPFRAAAKIAQWMGADSRAWGGFDAKSPIEDYSRRNLTYASDRLRAFEGFGRRISQATNQVYEMGLWSRVRAKGLFWYCQEAGPPNESVSSWCWASHNAPISLYTALPADDLLMRVNLPEMRGGFDGDLVRCDIVSPQDQRLDLSATQKLLLVRAHCVTVSALAGTAASFAKDWAILDDHVKIWPQHYETWKPEQCQFIVPMESGARVSRLADDRLSKRHRIEMKLAEMLDSYRARKLEAKIDEPAEVEFAGSQKPTPNTFHSFEKCIGIMRFDDRLTESEPTRSVKLVLLWHFAGRQYSRSEAIKKNASNQSSQRTAPSTASVTAAEAATPERHNVGLSLQRTYFFLAVQSTDDRTINDQPVYKRVGIGLGFWAPHLRSFGGLDVKAVAEIQDLVIK